jgi:pimeloyl-ACP methyl ester carboxylesterase
MATYVFVHGAWHSGACWHLVTPHFEQEGHTVLTPTLLGLGDTFAVNKPSGRLHVGIWDHVAQLVDLIRRQKAADLILVGHSYAGILITEAARVLPGAIRALVYLDALVPNPRQNTTPKLFAMKTPPPYLAPWMASLSRYALRSLPMPPPPLRFLIGAAAAQGLLGDWLTAHLTPMPLRFRESFHRFAPPPSEIPKTYIACHSPDPETQSVPLFSAPYEAYARSQGWPVTVLDCDHDAMLLVPEQLAQLLLLTAPVTTAVLS